MIPPPTTRTGRSTRGAGLVHEVDQAAERVRVRARQHAVPEVEHVARAAAVLRRGPSAAASSTAPTARAAAPGRGCPGRPGRPTSRRPSASAIRQSSPMTSPPAAAWSARIPAVPVPKWVAGTPRSAMPVEQAAHPRQRRGARSRAARARRPRSRTPGAPPRRPRPGRRGRRRRLDEAVHERGPRRGLGVHQPLRAHEVARRAALDEVAGERERRAGEPDQRHRRRARGRARIASSSGATAASGSNGRKRLDVGGGADRPLDDRPDALDDVERDARGPRAAS